MLRKLPNYDYMLCYRKIYGLSWTCECNFSTIQEADIRTEKLKQTDMTICTTIIPTYKFLPRIFKQYYAQYLLIPNIQMIDKCTHNPIIKRSDQKI